MHIIPPATDVVERCAEIDWVHVRFAKLGCFACRIERA